MSSYNSDGSFNKEAHNKDCKMAILGSMLSIIHSINKAGEMISNCANYLVDEQEFKEQIHNMWNELQKESAKIKSSIKALDPDGEITAPLTKWGNLSSASSVMQ